MKTLCLGSSGLLGSHLCALYPDVIPVNRQECDVTNHIQVRETIFKHKPDVVINCTGLTVKSAPTSDHMRVNAYAPKIIAQVCNEVGARMIQISTDCVFSGDRGSYNEDDYPDPIDPYGYSKYFGEVEYGNHTTIRCSFVGYPDPKRRSLLGWFERCTDPQIVGYSKAYWNGLTTVELSRIIMHYAEDYSYHSLIHVFGMEIISKYEMLKTVNDVYGWGKTVVPDPVVQIDRTLESVCWNDFTEVRKPFIQMIEEMKELKDVLSRH